ncbi:hypothetical protein [Bradyrhizobium sacchari]|uniref:hypothetical protein n=1 Tax=Bradyrhizobium sacchari TaxID=1399419 RepID=UPI0010A9579E|nr:hypothetical protein [Bradyrhizobium sacchari]
MLIDDVEGRRRWRRANPFQFPCQLRARWKYKDFRGLFELPEIFARLFRSQNLRFAQSLCGAQGLSLMAFNWARSSTR